MQNKVKEKDRKRKANKRVQMIEKELRLHQKANRAAVERHRATKYLRLHNLLEKQRAV